MPPPTVITTSCQSDAPAQQRGMAQVSSSRRVSTGDGRAGGEPEHELGKGLVAKHQVALAGEARSPAQTGEAR